MGAIEEVLGESTTTIKEYKEYKELKKAKFRKLAQRAIDLKYQMAEDEKEYKEVREEMLTMLITADAKTVAFEDQQIGIVEGRSGARLDKRKLVAGLLAAGMASKDVKKVMDSATTPGKEWTSVSIRGLKEDE